MKHFLMRAALIAILTLPSAAQIRYTDILPDTLLSADLAHPWAMYSADLNGDGEWDFTLTQFHPLADLDIAEVNAAMTGGREMLLDNEGVPRCLARGDEIDFEEALWYDTRSTALHMGRNWAGARDGFLGVRVRSGGTWLYGWIRLDVAANERTITVKDFACEMTPDKGIQAGSDGITGVPHAAAAAGITFRIAGSFLLVDTGAEVGPVDWILSDICGRVAARGILEHSISRIDCGAFKPGVYFLRILGRGSPAAGKLLLGEGRIHGIE